MKKPIDMTTITFYLVTGLIGYGIGLLSIMEALKSTRCLLITFYIITGLIAAAAGIIFIVAGVKEAIKEAREEGYG
jgi:ABC-type lipopolysaccharide export system ATPase subunit